MGLLGGTMGVPEEGKRGKGGAYTLGLCKLDALLVRFWPLYRVGSRSIIPIQTQNNEGREILGLRLECFQTQKWITQHPTQREQKESRSRHHNIHQNNFFIQGSKPQWIFNDDA